MKRVARHFAAAISFSLMLLIGGGLAYSMNTATSSLPLKQYFSRSQTNAIWDWSNPLNKSPVQLREISSFLYLHQINTVYVDAGGYADAAQESDSTKRANYLKALDSSFSSYITEMAKRKIKVLAAAGDASWSNRDEWQKPRAVLDGVLRFNDSHKNAQFAGVEFDVEAYNQPGFDTGSSTLKSLILTDYLDMVDYLATSLNSQPNGKKLELGFAIPYWFDNENGNIPSIVWNNQSGPTLYHLLDRLSSLQKSNVVVMAYRNAASGNDGIIAHSRTEIDYAAAKTPSVKVIIGQEVNEIEPEKITYYNKSPTELTAQFRIVEDEFKSSQSFGGIAINDLQGYQALNSVR